MSLSVGIVGLPNVGKSTIFNALTSLNVASENYAFCTIDPNHGIVQVPDSRIDVINKYAAENPPILIANPPSMEPNIILPVRDAVSSDIALVSILPSNNSGYRALLAVKSKTHPDPVSRILT